ncbi:hypothetical protein E2562_014222 [Oryza meyeriana var. granulata]|uniref:Uncharacterized protein n=1 Tax=Oryza meyeriana var. granulata TaxID=110450 RepID=A0A6G1BJ94_9ORYZ|nr:hypothetical protein E2562_014222 [Oryza meyeriana var. granulata]
MADEDSHALIIGDASALPSSSQGSSATPAQGQVGDANDPVIVADQEQEQQPPTKKQKKQTSDVWQRFTKVIETVQVDDSKAPPSIVGDLEILDVIMEQLINDDMEEVA